MSTRPYRVMVLGKYIYVGPDLNQACTTFANFTNGRTQAYAYDSNDMEEPIIHAIGADGKPVATLYNVPFGAWETGQPRPN